MVFHQSSRKVFKTEVDTREKTMAMKGMAVAWFGSHFEIKQNFMSLDLKSSWMLQVALDGPIK